MLDCVTTIPLPGRMLVHSDATSGTGAQRHAIPTFAAGPENRLVASTVEGVLHAASRFSRAPESPTTRLPFRLVFLFGASGCGKSHLSQGLVRYWQTQNGEETAVYTTAADFRHLLKDAMKRQAELEFRKQVRGRQFIAIEDLQHFPHDDLALQELRYLLDDYAEHGGTVVVTASSPPGVLPNLPPDLRSRLAAGLLLQLASPGEAARTHILRSAADALGCSLTDGAARSLAKGLDGSAHQLFNAVFELCSAKQPGTIDAVRAERLLARRAARRPTLREIIGAVARHLKITQAQLKSSSRRQSTVFARGLVAFLAREIADSNYEDIGRALGGRDHTTVLHGYHKIDQDRKQDPQIEQTLEELRRLLQAY